MFENFMEEITEIARADNERFNTEEFKQSRALKDKADAERRARRRARINETNEQVRKMVREGRLKIERYEWLEDLKSALGEANVGQIEDPIERRRAYRRVVYHQKTKRACEIMKDNAYKYMPFKPTPTPLQLDKK